MLSNKWTFSLASFVMVIAFGLMCAVPFASANDGDEAHVDKAGKKTKGTIGPHVDFSVTLSAAESMMDVSFRGDANANNIQIMRSTDDRGARVTTEETLQILATFGVVVHLGNPDVDPGTEADADELLERAGPFSTADIIIDAYDEEGRALGVLDLGAEEVELNDPLASVVTISHRDPNNPGKAFLIQIDEARLEDAYTALRGGGASLEIGTLIISIPPQSVQDATLSEVIRQRKGEHEPHWNAVSNVFQIDFVMMDTGAPEVVTIDRILDRSAFSPIETGPFNVRVILTEEPRMGTASGLTTDMIQVDGGGSATAVVAGLTIDGGTETANDGAVTRNAGDLTLGMIGTYYIAGEGVNADAVAEAEDAEETAIPNATGRDNEYYTYSVTITPNAGVTGDLIVSVKQFEDHLKPVSNDYLPLSAERRVATTLGEDASERNARLANETITVPVNTVGDTNVAAATAAYAARDVVLAAVANEKILAAKLVIPAGGYLVLGGTGINASSTKLAEKLSAASQLYNTTDLALPFPADDLDNFFRNGGTLNLGYADITAATGSGHGDSTATAAADHADNTGYAGATTNAYAAGAVIINEIMWGLDGAQPIADQKQSQYIELHNPGTAAITIDSKEWVITVGSLPTGYAAIDTVSNNPATGYWTVPGNGGVTAATAETPTVIDLVSMSRVTGGTDGTAAASWAASMRPSANISGRRIGSPGAANTYVMPTVVAPPTEAVVPAAAVAKAGDLMISEIMVASNDGRLPQWIEIANVSGAAVSVSGWSLEIENDSDDADVVGAGDSIVIDLGDVEIGADQVALVVSKEGRDTSGIGDGDGDLRADRIIDVQSQASPDNARYSLISEMGFMLSLIPPRTGAVRTPSDVVGNLDGGWELPMEEDLRSSLIRREMNEAGEIMGTDAAGWVLASDTMFSGAYRPTYYGSDNDIGTPGYDAGGALPVELSGFNAARDRVTGAVVITWSTQSELNNAGFFIKRSQQTNGKFVIVNPIMISGAGTTAEKQSYTYTDATADPNVIYYYQIEDVSLDGNRQTLTRAHRLKGHIGAAGKATRTWGELKSSRD